MRLIFKTIYSYIVQFTNFSVFQTTPKKKSLYSQNYDAGFRNNCVFFSEYSEFLFRIYNIIEFLLRIILFRIFQNILTRAKASPLGADFQNYIYTIVQFINFSDSLKKKKKVFTVKIMMQGLETIIFQNILTRAKASPLGAKHYSVLLLLLHTVPRVLTGARFLRLRRLLLCLHGGGTTWQTDHQFNQLILDKKKNLGFFFQIFFNFLFYFYFIFLFFFLNLFLDKLILDKKKVSLLGYYLGKSNQAEEEKIYYNLWWLDNLPWKMR